MKSLFLFFAIAAIVIKAGCQPNFPGNDVIFDDGSVPRVDITINPDTLAWIYDHVDSNIMWHATFVFNNGTIVDTVENVGFRLRGNTSRNSAKKSFKISFNTFEPGRKWYGLEKLNLNGEHNDPSVIRSKLSWDLLRAFDIPAPRSNHLRVYINNNYYGLYINVEHIDEEFVDSRFGNQDGNLYKCLYPADLQYLGQNPDLYKADNYGRRTYALKTNTAEDNYSDLAHFIDVLNNTSSENFVCEMNKIFNLYDFLKIIAVDIFIGDWDGYIYNKNNFYLYHNTETGKFEYIPYDLDNTWGVDFLGRDWGTRDIYDWEQHSGEARPLYTRIMGNQELKNQFSFYMNELLTSLVDTANYFDRIDEIKNMIEPYIQNDPYYPLDYGYTPQDFSDSYTLPVDGHVPYGLKPYIVTRIDHAMEQLQLNNMNPVIKYICNNQPQPGGDFWARAFVETNASSATVQLQYSINQNPTEYAIMYDDGDHHDRDPGDQIYGAIINGFEMNTTLTFQVYAEGNSGYSTTLPCNPNIVSLHPSTQPLLVINEFMADNDSIIADEAGEFDDWIELYNADDTAIWLGDKYLTDNLDNPDKWQMPDITLDPGNFILVWADGQTDQGNLHANFKLSKDGEEIGLSDAASTAFFTLDSIIYSTQETNVSFGREFDGELPWITLPSPTPGYSNSGEGIGELNTSDFKLFPNPATGLNVYFNRPADVVLYDVLGHKVCEKIQAKQLDVSELNGGIYFLKTKTGINRKIVVP